MLPGIYKKLAELNQRTSTAQLSSLPQINLSGVMGQNDSHDLISCYATYFTNYPWASPEVIIILMRKKRPKSTHEQNAELCIIFRMFQTSESPKLRMKPFGFYVIKYH